MIQSNHQLSAATNKKEPLWRKNQIQSGFGLWLHQCSIRGLDAGHGWILSESLSMVPKQSQISWCLLAMVTLCWCCDAEMTRKSLPSAAGLAAGVCSGKSFYFLPSSARFTLSSGRVYPSLKASVRVNSHQGFTMTMTMSLFSKRLPPQPELTVSKG